MKDDVLADVESETAEEPSITQQGGLKHKKALIAKLQRGQSGPGTPETPSTPGEEEPDPKKVKQDHPVGQDKMGEE